MGTLTGASGSMQPRPAPKPGPVPRVKAETGLPIGVTLTGGGRYCGRYFFEGTNYCGGAYGFGPQESEEQKKEALKKCDLDIQCMRHVAGKPLADDPLKGPYTAYAGQFTSLDYLTSHLQAAAVAEAAATAQAAGADSEGAAAAAAVAVASEAGGSRFGVQKRDNGAARAYVSVDGKNRYFSNADSEEQAAAMHGAAAVALLRYRFRRGLPLDKLPAMNVPLHLWEAGGGARFKSFLAGLSEEARVDFKQKLSGIISTCNDHRS
ncbi:hypothetical protein ABPG75_014042 [Micractinium tetrahymenae]